MEVPESEMLISLIGEAKLPFTFFNFVAGSNNEINRLTGGKSYKSIEYFYMYMGVFRRKMKAWKSC